MADEGASRKRKLPLPAAEDDSTTQNRHEEEDDKDDTEDSDSEDRVFAETVVHDAVPGYNFHFSLRKHYEYDEALQVGAVIKHHDVEVGSLESLLIDRNVIPCSQFHSLCDTESSELDGLGMLFCNANGTVRHADIDGLDQTKHTAASHGGFLHIEMVRVKPEHRHKDLGIHCTKALLEWLNVRDGSAPAGHIMRSAAEIRSNWTLAVIHIDFGASHLPEEAQAEEMATRKITLQFARLGFRQAQFGSSRWYLLPDRLELKSKLLVETFDISKIAEDPPLTEADEAVVEYFGSFESSSVEQFESELRALVATGASLQRAGALHLAVCNGAHTQPYLEVLLRCGNLDVNGADSLGNTALHTVATCVFKLNGNRLQQSANALIALGARRDAKNVFGNTPLLAFLREMRRNGDRHAAMGRARFGNVIGGGDEEKEAYDLTLTLLMPDERAALFESVLTPRQRHRLAYYATYKSGDLFAFMPKFPYGRPLPWDRQMYEVIYFEHIPPAVRTEKVSKRFVHGWGAVMNAVCETLCSASNPQLPTPEAVMKSLEERGQDVHADERDTNISSKTAGGSSLHSTRWSSLRASLGKAPTRIWSQAKTLTTNNTTACPRTPSMSAGPWCVTHCSARAGV